MKILFRLFLFLLLSISTKLEAQLYNFRNYSVEDGIAQSQVYSLVQDHRGLLWFGTRGGGLTRFDGLNFLSYTEKDGLGNNYIYDIVEDKKHNLWISTNVGISYFNGISFVNYIPEGYSSNVFVYKIALDKQQQVWMATSQGLMCFDGTKFRNISKEINRPIDNVNTVFIDEDGSIWFGESKGLFKIERKPSGNKLISFGEQSRYMRNAITAINKDSNGKIWIGTYGDGAYCYDGKKFFRFDHGQELYNATILDIYADNKDQIWFATLNNGLIQYKLSSTTFTRLTEKEGLSNNHVRKIIQDNNGNYWFGTSGGGVCNYFGKQFTTYDKSSGLGGSFIYSIFRDSKNRLWVGNSQKGLSVFSDEKFLNYNSTNGFEDVKVKSIVQGYNGVLYFGTDGKGVYSLIDSTFEPINALEKTYIRGMVRAQDNSIWIATAGNGLFKMTNDGEELKLVNYMYSNGLLSNRLTTVWCDTDGNIWYGTENNGVGCLNKNGKHIRKITIKNGLSSNNIRSITEDKQGYLWIGTAGAGVNRIKLKSPEAKPVVINYSNGLTSTNVYLLTTDHLDNLIIGTEKGLDYLFLDKQRRIKSIKHYSKGDGFTGVETCQNAVFKDNDGTIWFGTINGLIKFNPNNLSRNPFAPIIQITGIKLFYEQLSKTKFRHFLGEWNTVKKMDLPYGQNHITFDFFAVNLSNPEGVKYKWKLEGFDENWSPVSADRSILYSNLNPGKYRFLVKASNEDGVWTKNSASVVFTIAAPFWYTWWFIPSLVLIFISLVYFIIRWRFNQLRKKNEEEKNKLQMEIEIGELEQKALRLQMNPHFIFNALNSIQSQIGTGKDKEARYFLAKFSRLMRQILDNSRNATITLQEEISTLENYLLIEKFCNGDRFDYRIVVPEDLETDFIRIPPMILQPFVENAIKHGMRDIDGKTKRGEIVVEFSDKKDVIECTITDNGIGRKKSAELNDQSKETYHNSTSLLVTQERLDLLHGSNEKATLEIIDLYKDEIPVGTKVIIRIPIV